MTYYFAPDIKQDDSPFTWTYETMKQNAGRISGYIKIGLDVNSALALARMSPYPRSVELAVMKQVAAAKEITLEQMRIVLGFAARKSQAAAQA